MECRDGQTLTFGSILLVVCPLLDHELVEIAAEGVDHKCLREGRVLTRNRFNDFTKIGDQVAIS